METIRWVWARACIVAAFFLLGGCSHGDSASTSQDQTAAQSATSAGPASQSNAADAPATEASPSDAPDSPASPVADAVAPTDAPSGAPSGACTLIDTATVEKVLRLSVDTVKTDADSCDFSFKRAFTNVTVQFDASDGANDLDILRKTVGAASGAMNGAVNAVASAAPGIARMGAGIVSPGAPGGIPKLGDDQFAYGPSPTLFLGVLRGDSYVQISGVAMPDGMDPFAAAAELVRETFAHQQH
jgi:hypothetical protein